MATIRAVPRSRSASQAVQIYEDPSEQDVPVHNIHLDAPQDNEQGLIEAPRPEDALIEAINPSEAPEDNHVNHMVQGFEQLASPEHDAALAAEYSEIDEEHSDPQSDEDEDDDDPFESSELAEDGLDVQHSIEHDTPFRHERFSGRPVPITRASNHGYDRSFSTTTAIHLDDHVSPQLESEDEEDPFATSENLDYIQEHHDSRDYIKAAIVDDADRKISETWSALPDELPNYYKSPLPGRTMLYSHTRSPLSASRSHLASPPSPSPLANRERLLSSPTRSSERYLSTPTRHSKAQSVHHFQQDDDLRQYSATGRPVFRNPSSVQRMQMSSPPPFSPTQPPRAARHRREQSEGLSDSRHGSPFPPMQQHDSARGTPVRHPNPKKDYPLVLLHCTLSPLPSTFAFSPAVLEQVLPAAKLRDVALLKERLGSGGVTVLERGVLIPHPGDDYELLEERVLESLELRRPRVGGCGHFNPNVDADIDAPLQTSVAGIEVPSSRTDESKLGLNWDADCRCADCGSHMDHALLPGANAERRWDVRVYAANGLMRSGAWSAAWREMEKVDVEVGVWLDDSLRRALDGASLVEEAGDKSHRLEERNVWRQEEMRDIQDQGEQSRQLLPPPPAPMPPSGSDAGQAASTATGRPGTSGGPKTRRITIPGKQSSLRTREAGQRQIQLPLQTLLVNYILRTVDENRALILAVAAMMAGIWLAISSRSSGGNLATSAAAGLAPAGPAEVKVSTAVVTSTATQTIVETVPAARTFGVGSATETMTVTTTLTEQLAAATPVGTSLAGNAIDLSQACTFAVEDADEHSAMTALPRDVAARVLGALVAEKESLTMVRSEADGEASSEEGLAGQDGLQDADNQVWEESALTNGAIDTDLEILEA